MGRYSLYLLLPHTYDIKNLLALRLQIINGKVIISFLSGGVKTKNSEKLFFTVQILLFWEGLKTKIFSSGTPVSSVEYNLITR
jgi:hypothetical protein